MTPCYICESPIDDLRTGPDLRPLPCSKCLAIVADTVGSYDEDKRALDEDFVDHESLDEFLENKKTYAT